MIYRTIKKNGYNLHIIKTTRFKTISMKLVFWNELKEDELSLRNMLADNLLFSCSKYNNNQKMAIKKQDLYSINLYGSTYRIGTQINTEIGLSCIEDKYTEPGNFKEALDFLFECLYNPNVCNGQFDETAFAITKKRLIAALQSEKDNPANYCYQRYKQIIGNKKVLTGSILGTIDSIEKITPEALYDYYKRLFKENHLDIYVVGNIDEKFIEEYLEKFVNIDSSNIKYTKASTTYEKDFTENVEPSSFNQSKLLMGGSIKDLTEHEKKYESIIYNIILGNSPNSKLFQNVREKKSYAYTISSSLVRLDGMFVISAGISYKNFINTKKEIQKELNQMKLGKFSLKSIKNAKEMILSILKEIEDSPWSIIDHYNNYLYYGADSIEVQKEEIKKVTKQDIINVAKKISIDTIYLLKEDTYEKN